MKEALEQVVGVCSLKMLAVAHPWEQCQRLCCLDLVHLLGSHPQFCSHVTEQMILAVVMKKISMEARTRVTQVALGMGSRCRHLMGNLVYMDLPKGMAPEGVNRGRQWKEENAMADAKENGKENIDYFYFGFSFLR